MTPPEAPASSAARRAVIVLGMHRSGTSVITRGLMALGVALGDRLLEARADNPTGFWEDRDIVGLNERALAALGIAWHGVSAVPEGAWQRPELADLRAEAVALLRGRFGHEALWGFKDPRACRLLPFWEPVIAEVGFDPWHLLVIRDPADTAASLARRNGFSPEMAHLLWLRHMLEAVVCATAAGSASEQRLLMVDYDRFLVDAHGQLDRIAAWLGIAETDPHPVERAEFERDFVDAGLSHADPAERALFAGSPRAAAAARFYDALVGAAANGGGAIAGLRAACDSAAAALEEAGPVAALMDRYLNVDRARIEHLEHAVQVRDQALAVRDSMLRRRGSEITRLTELLQRERFTVVKPALRSVYRALRGAVLRLPAPLREPLRALKRWVHPREVRLLWTPGGARSAGTAPAPPSPKARLLARLGRAPRGPHAQPLARVRAARGAHPDIVLFGIVDWHFRVQRPQHLARELARLGHRVFYVIPRFAQGAVTPGYRLTDAPEERLYVVQPHCAGARPNPYQDFLSSDDLAFIGAGLDRMRADCAVGPVVSVVQLPFWRPLALGIPGSLLVYDMMDHHAGFSTNSPLMVAEEERLVADGDVVVVTSDALFEATAPKCEPVLIRNAAEVERFARRPAVLRDLGGAPVVGYIGAISEWFDLPLVTAAARRYPDWTFALIGSTRGCDVSAAERLPNIRFLGEIPYADLSGYLHAFRVCLIPFRITDLTRATNPVKVYEYLAAGKPVVATAMPEVARLGDLVHIGADQAGFIGALGRAMGEADDPVQAERRRAWALQHDWGARAGDFHAAIAAQYPKISVVVLTYNNLELTRACLESLERFTAYPDWELILVDNASADDTPEFLRGYGAEHPEVRVILNDQNLGFAGGSNLGLNATTGEYLVILNNDTYVTQGWLGDLIRHLRRDPQLGLVGPVTNNIGNEARIDIRYEGMAQMAREALIYTRAHPRDLLPSPNLGFFCVALPRIVYETTGPLDEEFRIGWFEDDDYCNRVRMAGYGIAIAEDVFVHHHLSAAFKLIESEERKALFERNKAIYERKWGPWLPHRHR